LRILLPYKKKFPRFSNENNSLNCECFFYRIEIDNGRAVLYIEDAKKTDAAWFQCTAVNVAGSAMTKAKLVVTGKLQ
jgi:hypothetical protein